MPNVSAGEDAGEERIAEDAAARFAAAENEHALDEAKAAFLNKNGVLQPLLRQIGALPAAERPAAGQKLNELRRRIEKLYEEGRARLRENAVSRSASVAS